MLTVVPRCACAFVCASAPVFVCLRLCVCACVCVSVSVPLLPLPLPVNVYVSAGAPRLITALHVASYHNQEDMVQLLLDKGIKVGGFFRKQFEFGRVL